MDCPATRVESPRPLRVRMADTVSLGSTSGAIDETALYYLRSRGVPLRQAQGLLVLAFLAEAITEIEDEAIAEDIRVRLESWLARHDH